MKIKNWRAPFNIDSKHYLVALAILPFLMPALFFWFSTATQPLIDQHEFRQCQTALSAFWVDLKRPIHSLFYYETPVFGHPWQTPFEFPVYQILAKLLSKLTDLPLPQAGRILSAGMFLSCLIPIYSIVLRLNLGRRFFVVSAIFLLCSPFYLYWSRAFLIESTTLLFGFLFLVFYLKNLIQSNSINLFLSIFFGIMCALCKVTTFPCFGIAAVGILLLSRFTINQSRTSFKILAKDFIVLSIIGSLVIFAAFLWIRHTDEIKNSGLISYINTSESLRNWNFGTLEQRRDPNLWKALMVGRSLPYILGSPYVLLGFLLAPFFLSKRSQLLTLFLVLLYIIPFFIFTNLYWRHDYYQYANGVWLLLALAFVFSEASKKMPIVCACLVLMTAGLQIRGFLIRSFPHTQTNTKDFLSVAKIIKEMTPPESCMLVIGEDWNPRLAFYAERKSIYIPYIINLKTVKSIFEEVKKNPCSITSGEKLAVVFNKKAGLDGYSSSVRTEIQKYLENSTVVFTKNQTKEFEIYTKQ